MEAYRMGAQQELSCRPGEGSHSRAGLGEGLAEHQRQTHIRQLGVAPLQQHVG